MTNEMEKSRKNWEQHVHQRSDTAVATPTANKLPAPAKLTAEAGVGHITLRWQPVRGAMGYLVSRDAGEGGKLEPLNHGGGDVLAVPGCFYDDSLIQPGRNYQYAVASIVSPELPPGERTAPVTAAPRSGEPGPVTIGVDSHHAAGHIDPLWHMLGSEHLSEMFYTDKTGGQPIGEEVQRALEIAHAELGTTSVRAHAILNDEQHLYTERDGEPVYNFRAIDRIYDRLLDLGIRPVVELSFMPRDLASNPDVTVFQYHSIISPPKDWSRWAELNRRLAAHFVERYTVEEVRRWPFEVWNEPNLSVFWTGTQAEYFRLYDLAARAIKSVDDRIPVGGPSTAAAEWIPAFLDFCQSSNSPVDFITTHTYGNIPLNVREAATVRGMQNLDVYWTEWGVSPTHFHLLNDWVYGAPLLLHGMKQCQGRADALSHWVVSDHFEEQGRSPRLFHGGFGLLTVGNLRKPTFWAVYLAETLGRDLVSVELHGDGAGTVVDAWATRKPDGTVSLLVWNGTLAQTPTAKNPTLNRTLQFRLRGLEAERYQATLARIDTGHSNIMCYWSGDTAWPTEAEWSALHTADQLDEDSLPVMQATGGKVELTADLPNPGVLGLRLVPAR